MDRPRFARVIHPRSFGPISRREAPAYQVILQFLHNSTPLKSSQGLYTAIGSLVCGRSLGP
jgi:hypothetical protein